MKKYTQPELSISMFDIEDVITNSGTMFTTGETTAIQQIAKELGGTIVDANDQEFVSNTAAAYLGWTN